jgi:uncharacterized membrane protein
MVTLTNRINSIDLVRGLVMIIMALDHVRDFFHITANTEDPLNIATTTPALFFTRWITHFCAPVFVFLSGTSIYLQGLRKTKRELGGFLIKRGLWLILAEFTIVAFAWTYNPYYNFIPMQVIWAIGISMVIIGLLMLTKISYSLMLIIGLIVVGGHNLLDRYEANPVYTTNFFWDLFHRGVFKPYEYAPNHYLVMVYPFPVWTAVMMLGYCLGVLFKPDCPVLLRHKRLVQIGLFLIGLFIALRYLQVYGDPHKWTRQDSVVMNLLSFINLEKYPPSLMYLCLTLGPALLLLRITEEINSAFTRMISVFGRTAFFYYILHLYLIHFLAVIGFLARGHSFSEGKSAERQVPFWFVVPGEGLGLLGVYLVWVLVIVILYPICQSYDRYKTNHKEKWWLSYF